MILATDLDGTFLGGDDAQRLLLYDLIRRSENLKLIFVTGRGIESVLSLFEEPELPRPDFIIADVGATIVDGHTLESIEPIQQQIESAWPGQDMIFDAMKEFEALKVQSVPQRRRCSFILSDSSILPRVYETVDKLGCDSIYSAGKYLDILGRGVNKGSTLSRLANLMGQNADEILVAGDTMNDISLYRQGFKGVVVGNAEKELVNLTREMSGVFHASTEGAGGIHESLHHFRFI